MPLGVMRLHRLAAHRRRLSGWKISRVVRPFNPVFRPESVDKFDQVRHLLFRHA
jgi:hypothetical protein